MVGDDAAWKALLREMNRRFRYRTVSGQEVEDFLSERVGRDLASLFDQYLRTTDIPRLEYRWQADGMAYRWTNAVPDFDMPVRVFVGQDTYVLSATRDWKVLEGVRDAQDVEVSRDYFVDLQVTGDTGGLATRRQ